MDKFIRSLERCTRPSWELEIFTEKKDSTSYHLLWEYGDGEGGAERMFLFVTKPHPEQDLWVVLREQGESGQFEVLFPGGDTESAQAFLKDFHEWAEHMPWFDYPEWVENGRPGLDDSPE